MRTQKLIADMKLRCGHTVQGEIRHNVKTAWCKTCDDSIHIEHVYVHSCKCKECRFGRKDTNLIKVYRTAARHSETTGHTVEMFDMEGKATGELEPGTRSML